MARWEHEREAKASDWTGATPRADALTVTNELTWSGQLARVGGAVYLDTLLSTAPTAANAGYYTQIVGERAVLRRLVTAGTRIVQMVSAEQPNPRCARRHLILNRGE
jgi:replicative DNA helicase